MGTPDINYIKVYETTQRSGKRTDDSTLNTF